jgi:hypothetical protein
LRRLVGHTSFGLPEGHQRLVRLQCGGCQSPTPRYQDFMNGPNGSAPLNAVAQDRRYVVGFAFPLHPTPGGDYRGLAEALGPLAADTPNGSNGAFDDFVVA